MLEHRPLVLRLPAKKLKRLIPQRCYILISDWSEDQITGLMQQYWLYTKRIIVYSWSFRNLLPQIYFQDTSSYMCVYGCVCVPSHWHCPEAWAAAGSCPPRPSCKAGWVQTLCGSSHRWPPRWGSSLCSAASLPGSSSSGMGTWSSLFTSEQSSIS